MSEEAAKSEMTCLHEAGHALIAHLLGIEILSIKINMESNALPGTEILTKDFNKLETHHKLMFFMGGYAAEKIYTDIISNEPRHRLHKYVQKLFSENIEFSISLDMQKAREISGVDGDTLIYQAKLNAEYLLRKNISLLANLFKSICEHDGIMTGKELQVFFSNRVLKN
jgi:hypothetical protein